MKVSSSAQGFGTTSESSLESTTWQKEQEGPIALASGTEPNTLSEGLLSPALRSLHGSGKTVAMAVTYEDYHTRNKKRTAKRQFISFRRFQQGVSNSGLHGLRFTLRGNEGDIDATMKRNDITHVLSAAFPVQLIKRAATTESRSQHLVHTGIGGLRNTGGQSSQSEHFISANLKDEGAYRLFPFTARIGPPLVITIGAVLHSPRERFNSFVFMISILYVTHCTQWNGSIFQSRDEMKGQLTTNTRQWPYYT